MDLNRLVVHTGFSGLVWFGLVWLGCWPVAWQPRIGLGGVLMIGHGVASYECSPLRDLVLCCRSQGQPRTGFVGCL